MKTFLIIYGEFFNVGSHTSQIVKHEIRQAETAKGAVDVAEIEPSAVWDVLELHGTLTPVDWS